MEEKLSSTKIQARIKLKVASKNNRDYLELAEQTVLAIKNYEKNTLFQNLYTDANDPQNLIWLITFKNFEALLSFFNSPIIALYLANDQILGDRYDLEIYGQITEEELEELTRMKLTSKIYNSNFGLDNLNH